MDLDEVLQISFYKINEEQVNFLLKNISEQDKDNLIKYLIEMIQFNDRIENDIHELETDTRNMERHILDKIRESLRLNQKMVDELLDRLSESDLEVLNKEDIIQIFKWEDQKARAFLKMALKMGYGTKINKNIVITKESFKEYLKFLQGKDLTI